MPPQSLITVRSRLPDGYLGCSQARCHFNVRSVDRILRRVVS
jgi:hypothetical protein